MSSVTFDKTTGLPSWAYGGIKCPRQVSLRRGERLFRIGSRGPLPDWGSWWLRENDYCILQALMMRPGHTYGGNARRAAAIAPSFENAADVILEAVVVDPQTPAFAGVGKKYQRPIGLTDSGGSRQFEVACAHPCVTQLYLAALDRGAPAYMKPQRGSVLQLVRIDALWSSPPNGP